MNSDLHLRNSYQRSKRMINILFGILAIETLMIALSFFAGYTLGKTKHIKEVEQMIEHYYEQEIEKEN